MKKINVIVEQAQDGTFWCYTDGEVYGVGLNSAGSSVEEAKADLMACLEEARTDYEENGGKAYEVEFAYRYDLQSFFNYFSFLNVTDISKRAGINPSLMRQYARGIKHAGEKTYSRLSACLSTISKELQTASFK